jgi:hypothetical protein
MLKWEAAVATENPKILYRIVKLLKELKIKFVICLPVDHRCEHAHIVISGPDDNSLQHKNRIEVTEDFDDNLVRIEIMSKLYDIHTPYRAIVGIDPGMTYGVALVIDGISVYSCSLTSPSEVVKLTRTLLEYTDALFPESEQIIRVGTGSKLYTALTLRSFKNSSINSPLELVNEHRTTIISGARSDESAAILIAGRTGRAMTDSDVNIEPKAGYIRSLKQYVSKLTRGTKSLTSNEARSLISGESTLEDVLNIPNS